MKLSRTDLVAVVAIIGGVGIGGFLTLRPRVLQSPAEDAPVSADAYVPRTASDDRHAGWLQHDRPWNHGAEARRH